jgi:hypothetical protein
VVRGLADRFVGVLKGAEFGEVVSGWGMGGGHHAKLEAKILRYGNPINYTPPNTNSRRCRQFSKCEILLVCSSLQSASRYHTRINEDGGFDWRLEQCKPYALQLSCFS